MIKQQIMCMLTQEWLLEQHGLDGEKHKMRIKYLFYKIVSGSMPIVILYIVMTLPKQ